MTKKDTITELNELADSLEDEKKRVIEFAQFHIRATDEENERLRADLASTDEENKRLRADLAALKKSYGARFRPSTERVSPGQLSLSLLGYMANPDSGNGEESAEDSDSNKKGSGKPKRKKRRSGISMLPVDKVERKLTEQERQCDCGREMKPDGFKIERQVVYTPPSLRMLEEHLEKCSCEYCDGSAAAKGAPKPIEGALASPSLLAQLCVAKGIDATPVERTGRQWARLGADFASSTLHNWMGRACILAEVFAPIAREKLLESYIISLDDTRLLSKKALEGDGTQKGRFWVYIGDVDRIVLCKYTPDWKGRHPSELLGDYDGILQLDGYAGINPLFERNGELTRVGCNDHCRRFFARALQEGDARAGPVIEAYGKVYAVETEATALGLNPMQRLQMRKERTMPLWLDLTAAIEGVRLQTPSTKSALGRGLVYWDKQRPTLEVFLDDGFVPISNAHVERLIRLIALMRKNSLFVGTVEAGERYASLMTLLLNCVVCGANPYEYLRDIFTRISQGIPNGAYAELLPRPWLMARSQLQ